MEHSNYYPWFEKLKRTLEIYYEYTRRLNATVNEQRTTPKQRISDIQFLLVYFSEALAEAERNFLDVTQFNSNACLNCIDSRFEHTSMGLIFTYYAN
jgi:hypothetical protein